MQEPVFSYSGEVQSALICLAAIVVAALYSVSLVAGRAHAKRRQREAMTSSELQARVAKDVTSANVDRMLPKSLRKNQP